MFIADYFRYKAKLKSYATVELGFDDNYEFALFKYAHHISLSRKEFNQIMTGKVPCDSSKKWKKYVKKKYNKKKSEKYRQDIITNAKIQREEYKVFEEYNSGVFLVILATLLVQLGVVLYDPINGVDFSNYSKIVAIITSIIYSGVCSFILVVLIVPISFLLTKEMKRRKYRKLFYTELINALED